ncbi:beta strand repeat-containing protein [Hymenobacter artigasi]|uniref:G8 domain-containing protein n=1 Tax=Hymenobacter artigasi TaxID=2719616 RepID=A0ABX1HJH4_9BACT|nr:T9SS type A sorting domain-containing protein [Hymenobacter artigasi]NKI90044.1 hypothetical protein [Hymenobacter artigasi]
MQHNLPFTNASQSLLVGSRRPVAGRSWRPMVAAALGLLSISVGASAQNRAFPLPQAAEKVARPLSAAPVAVQPVRAVAARQVLSAISSTAAGGNWSAPATWVGGVVPTAADDVTIVAGATVTLDVAAAAASLNIAATGSLLTSATTVYQLQVAGDVTNNGVLDLSNSATIGSDLRFTGAGNAAFTGTGTTDLQTVSLAKSVRADIVEMNLPTLSVKGSTTSGDGFLSTRITTNTVDDMTGTLKISGTATISNKVFSNAASYFIPATGGFWLNNANFTVASQTGSPTVNGSLRISTGTYNVGSSIGNSILFGSAAVYTQEGGTLNTVGRFGSFTSATSAAAMTFTLNGGTLNVSTVGNASGTPSFGVNGTNVVSGGTINLVQRSTAATPLDYYVAGTYTYTGGTVNVGTAATATNFDFRIRGTFPNLTIDNTTNPKSALLQGQTNVYGTTLTTPGATLNLNGLLLLQFGAAVTNNGTLTGTTASSTVYFAGSVPQTMGGTGTFSVIRTITVDNSGGGVTLSVPVVTTRVNLFTGNLNGGSNLTIGDATAAFFVIQIGVTSNPNTSGSITSAPTFNIGSGALQLIYAPELTARTTGFEIPATRIVDAVSIANPMGVILAGGNLLVNASGVSTGSLLLSSGILTTSATNKLTLGTAAATLPTGSATSYVKGLLGITVNSATAVARTFAVGDAAGWRPVVVSGITAATDQVFTATVVSGATGGTGVSPVTNLNPTRYVRLENTANLPATATVQLSYGADDVLGNTATAVVAQAATATGAYASIGGAAATVPATGLVSTTSLTPGNDFFVLANTEGGTLSTSVAAVCSGTNSGTITLASNVGTIVKYQADNGSGFVDVAGTNTTSTLAFSNLTATTTFRAVILTADSRTVFSAPVTVTVNPAPTAALAATSATTFCGPGSLTLAATPVTGATYQYQLNGANITGATSASYTATVSASGSYTVIVTSAAGCTATSTPVAVTVNPATTATFAYSAATYCATGTNPTATVTGTAGGTFSSTTGLSINATTGAINLSASTLGTYTVTYSVSGICPSSATASVTITSGQAATFSYPAATTYCAGSTSTVSPTLGTGASAGTFTSTTGLSINATTGVITLSTSTAGTYTVTNTVAAAGSCAAATATTSVTVTPATTATFAYSGATYCATGTNPTATVTGTAGGTFSSTAGLSLNASTGAINLSASTPGTYTVTYTVAGACGSSATASVTITAAPTATFSYATTTGCAGSTTAVTPTLGTGASAGTYSSTTGLVINATTGAITLATSTAGTYTVTNTVAAAGGCAAATATATFTVNPRPATPTISVVYNGTTTTLTSSATTGNQFFLNGVAIAGATGQTYVVNGLPAQYGSYTVTTTNANGCVSLPSTALVVTSSVKPLAGTSLSVFPNPTHDGNLKVELTGYRAPAELTVLNALGQVVFAATVPASNGTTTQAVNLTQLSTGIYILRVKTEGGLDTRRVVKD